MQKYKIFDYVISTGVKRSGEIFAIQLLCIIRLLEIYSPLANAFASLRSRLHFVSLEMTRGECFSQKGGNLIMTTNDEKLLYLQKFCHYEI